ncbi:hypothetical protein ACFL0V_00400 [Nanoarchaeota archaeon]
MKKSLLLLLIILFSTSAYAAVMDTKLFNINVDAVEDKILDTKKGYGEVYVNIENLFTEPETFRFVFLDPPNWKEQLIPNPSDRYITIEPEQTGQFHFYVKPSWAPEGVQPVSVILESEKTGIRFKKTFHIQFGEKEAPAILTPPDPDLSVSISVPAMMDPRKSYTVVVDLKNNNEAYLENVTVKLGSKNINDQSIVDIGPNESKGISFTVLFNDDLPPQKDSLYVSVTHEGKSWYDQHHNFEVVEYLPPFDISVDVEKKIWRRDRLVSITNDGNTDKTDVVRLETSLRERMFTSSVPEYRVLEDKGKQYFAWDVTLPAGESTTITSKTSYRILWLPILLILLYFAYLIKKLNPVVVKKKFKSTKKQHGAISEMSIAIYLKNTGNKPITNVRVIERVTKMVALKKDSFEGSMHPVKMHKHANEGTLMEYVFPELGAGDERIITYKAHSKLHMFGTITIKPTVVEFKKRSGAKMKSKSNQISIQTEKSQTKHKK